MSKELSLWDYFRYQLATGAPANEIKAYPETCLRQPLWWLARHWRFLCGVNRLVWFSISHWYWKFTWDEIVLWNYARKGKIACIPINATTGQLCSNRNPKKVSQ